MSSSFITLTVVLWGEAKRLTSSNPRTYPTKPGFKTKAINVAEQSAFKRVVSFTKELINNYLEDDALNLGAALAYYTVFSFAPLLMIATTVASYFVGEDAASGRLYGEISSLLGDSAAETIQEIVSNAYTSGDNFWATAISIGTLVFAATGVFFNLQVSLNKIWEIKPTPENGIKAMVMKRLLSFSFVIGLGFLLLVTMVVNAAVLGFMDKLAELIPGLGQLVLAIGTWLLTTAITAGVFTVMLRFLPDAKARWRDIFAGALFAAILFGLGRMVIGFYIGNSDFSSTYGAAGALITLLIWTYYNSQILFLGAEFTYVWAARNGNPIVPDDHAVRIRVKTVPVDQLGRTEREAAREEADAGATADAGGDQAYDQSAKERAKQRIQDDPDRVSQRPVG